MGLNLQTYSALRPMLYHGTAIANVASIRAERALHSTKVLAPDHADVKRCGDVVVVRGGHVITLRDQCALKLGHVELTGGWCWEDLIATLNQRVFFWPGTHSGPIEYGRRLFNAYSGRPQAVLRVEFEQLVQANPGMPPYFCRFNSGAPRTVEGRKSPRGSDTFLTAEEWTYPQWQVAEVSFVGSVCLPGTTEIWDGAHSWRRL